MANTQKNATNDSAKTGKSNDTNGNNGPDRSDDLRQSPMMAHLLDALEAGADIGHYGRLTFPICPNSDDPDSCNVYRELRFPDHIYENIEEYYEEKADAQKS